MAKSWVVFRTPVKDVPAGMPGVWTGPEWEAMDEARPGFYTLVRAGIPNEGEAERLARGTAGQAPTRASTKPPAGAGRTLPDKAGR